MPKKEPPKKVFLPAVISDLFGVTQDTAENEILRGSTSISGEDQNFRKPADLWFFEKDLVEKEVKVEGGLQSFAFVYVPPEA